MRDWLVWRKVKGQKWKDKNLGHVGGGRAVHAGFVIDSTLWAIPAVAD